MKKSSMALLIGTTLFVTACGGVKDTTESNTEQAADSDQYSYALGARMGNFARSQLARQQELNLAGDKAALLAGFRDGFDGQSSLSEEEIAKLVDDFSIKFREADNANRQLAAIQRLEQNKTYFSENGQREGVITTGSGLQYEIITQGDGASPSATDRVRVHYHGTLVNGEVFDSSVDRGQPSEFGLNRVIPGWTEGVQLMQVGSKYKFHVPSALGYGQRGQNDIPANSTLIFEVELLAIAPFTE